MRVKKIFFLHYRCRSVLCLSRNCCRCCRCCWCHCRWGQTIWRTPMFSPLCAEKKKKRKQESNDIILIFFLGAFVRVSIVTKLLIAIASPLPIISLIASLFFTRLVPASYLLSPLLLAYAKSSFSLTFLYIITLIQIKWCFRAACLTWYNFALYSVCWLTDPWEHTRFSLRSWAPFIIGVGIRWRYRCLLPSSPIGFHEVWFDSWQTCEVKY